MKCSKCPLYSYWSNENDRGESCGLFGDAWDSRFQYEDKLGNVVGCYIDRHLIEKADEAKSRVVCALGDDVDSAIADLEEIAELFS